MVFIPLACRITNSLDTKRAVVYTHTQAGVKSLELSSIMVVDRVQFRVFCPDQPALVQPNRGMMGTMKRGKTTMKTMIHIGRAILVAGLILAAAMVHASDSPVAMAGTVNVAALPYEAIGQLTSEAGETEQAFLARIAPQLRTYSDRTGFEACGMVATDGASHFGVVLGSNHSHIGCVNDPTRVPDGMTSTGRTIHSHGRQGLRVRATEADWILMGNPQDPPHYIGGFDLSHFSDQDYQQPGYLATPNGLIFQAGARQVETIKG